MSHYEERLERDLDRLRTRFRLMGKDVRQQVDNSIRALFGGDRELASLTVISDEKINREMREIDQLCYAFIVRHLPAAGLLRLLAAIIRVNIQLERIGDYSVTIARSSARLNSPPQGHILRELKLIVDESKRMLDQALDAFHQQDEAMANATIQMHAHLGPTLDGIYEELLTSSANRETREIIAFFVVFNMLKRVSDQAKNICEETIFTVTGHVKAAKVYRVLFVDEDNAYLGPMAESIAKKAFPSAATFSSAGRAPATAFRTDMLAFMADHGIELASSAPRMIDADTTKLAETDLIINLQGRVTSVIPEIPFHTSAFDWDVREVPTGLGDAETQDRFESLYRDLATRIHDLMGILCGEGTERSGE